MTLLSLCSVVVLINVLCYIVCSLYHKYIIAILTGYGPRTAVLTVIRVVYQDVL